MSRPGHIKDEGGLAQPVLFFVTDVAPTIYELAHIPVSEVVGWCVKQLPLEGASLAFSFDDAQAPSRHNLQYFEMVGNRGIYKDGWWAGLRTSVPWARGLQGEQEPNKWELYDLTHDFSQAHDLADQNPDKLKELQDLYAAEAERNHVYPQSGRGLFGGGAGFAGGGAGVRGFGRGRGANSNQASLQTSWTFRSGAERIAAQYAPRIGGSSHRITAEIEVGDETPNGVIFANGGRTGGVVLFVKDGQVVYEGTPRSSFPATVPHTQIIATERLPKGKSVIEVVATRIEPPAGDTASTPVQGSQADQGFGGFAGANTNQAFNIALLINGKTVGTGEFKGIPFGGAGVLGGGFGRGGFRIRDQRPRC